MRYFTAVTLVLLVFVSSLASASVSVLGRVDTIGAGDPCYTVGLTDTKSGIELWALGLPEFPDYEIGKTWLVKKLSSEKTQVYFSAYAVVWPKAEPRDQYFLLPWPSLTTKLGSARITADAFAYVPLNGGPLCVGTNDTGISWLVGNKLQLGFSATYWKQEGCESLHGVGPQAVWSLAKDASLTVRYIPDSLGTESSFRVQFNCIAF